MITHDYKCLKCGNWIEVRWLSFAEFRREVGCNVCDGVAVHAWRQAPGLSGVEEPSSRGVTRTFHAGFDVQAGRHFSSRSERERWARDRGLVGLSPQEFKRTVKDSEPDVKMDGLGEAMQKSWEELHAGKPAPPLGKIDPNEPIITKENRNG